MSVVSPSRRIRPLAAAADTAAVVVFAAVGRRSHAEPGDLLGLATTVAPFAVGMAVAWATPVVRRHPAGLRAGAVTVLLTAGVGLLLRAAFTGRLPLSFALVAITVLAALLLGWRGIAALVSRTVSRTSR